MHTSLSDHLNDAFQPHWPERLGVAVSGGGDSVALLHIAHEICLKNGTELRAVTVDHGLRAGSAAEAQNVAAMCARLAVSHETLVWENWSGQGNLQNHARNARYQLISDWAHQNRLSTVALGHTADDQAETLLMRLARKSGVDGLAGMAPRRMQNDISWVRPLLACRREALRDYLRNRNVTWIEDPSNDDPSFERIKMRGALKELAGVGITVEALRTVSENMAAARTALNWQTFMAFRDIGHLDAGSVVLCERKMLALPDEIQRRILVQAVQWIGPRSYTPRREAVFAMIKAITNQKTMTLDGCQMQVKDGQIWIFREHNAVKNMQGPALGVFDNRWRLHSSEPMTLDGRLQVRALGPEGLLQCPKWRETGRPRAALLASPSIWREDELIAAPLANPSCKWRAELENDEDTFLAALLSH